MSLTDHPYCQVAYSTIWYSLRFVLGKCNMEPELNKYVQSNLSKTNTLGTYIKWLYQTSGLLEKVIFRETFGHEKKGLLTWQNKLRENDEVVFGNILVNFGPDWGWSRSQKIDTQLNTYVRSKKTGPEKKLVVLSRRSSYGCGSYIDARLVLNIDHLKL